MCTYCNVSATALYLKQAKIHNYNRSWGRGRDLPLAIASGVVIPWIAGRIDLPGRSRGDNIRLTVTLKNIRFASNKREIK